MNIIKKRLINEMCIYIFNYQNIILDKMFIYLYGLY